jgi:hypothetical protein
MPLARRTQQEQHVRRTVVVAQASPTPALQHCRTTAPSTLAATPTGLPRVWLTSNRQSNSGQSQPHVGSPGAFAAAVMRIEL